VNPKAEISYTTSLTGSMPTIKLDFSTLGSRRGCDSWVGVGEANYWRCVRLQSTATST
jgi:hypothetical protein